MPHLVGGPHRPDDHVAQDEAYDAGEVAQEILVTEQDSLGLARLKLGKDSGKKNTHYRKYMYINTPNT